MIQVALPIMSFPHYAAAGSSTGWHEGSVRVGGQVRWYRIYAPQSLPPGAPLVLLLHGGGQSMRKIFSPKSGGTNGWPALAAKEKFLLVVPNGTNPKTGDTAGDRQNWHDNRPAGTRGVPGSDDVGFIRALLKEVEHRYAVDRTRIYITGVSNGGLMAYALLMKMPSRFAAASVFIANLPSAGHDVQSPPQPCPLMLLSGTKDPLMKWDGGRILVNRGHVMSAQATVAWWVMANHADISMPEIRWMPDVDVSDGCRIRRTAYKAKPGGAPVVFYAVEGGGHAIPSQHYAVAGTLAKKALIGEVCRDAEGSDLAWHFMKQFRLAKKPSGM